MMARLLFISFVFFLSCKVSNNKSLHKVEQFSNSQIELITGVSDSSTMRILQLDQASDSIILRTKSNPFTTGFSSEPYFMKLVTKMELTLKSALGVGIAAPQVGILKQLICVQRFDKEGFPFEFYVNPKILQYTKKTQACQEGCLSIANKQGNSDKRAYAILIEYLTIEGIKKIEMVEDFTAVIFQHEIDHLNGIMFTDHLEKESKKEN